MSYGGDGGIGWVLVSKSLSPDGGEDRWCGGHSFRMIEFRAIAEKTVLLVKSQIHPYNI
jgi:hypothetical protein